MKPDELSPNVRLTVSGVVSLGGFAFMHPESFRQEFGEEVYQELLSRPRIVCVYDYDEE